MSAIRKIVRMLCLIALSVSIFAQPTPQSNSVAIPVAASCATPDEIRARLKDKPLYIRGFWSDNTLHFDGSGTLAKPSKRSTFALDGFSFTSLKLKDGALTLSGKAVGVEFLKDGPKRVDLPVGERTIKITAPANGDYGVALDAIFVNGLEALAPSLPPYLQRWARKTYSSSFSGKADEVSVDDFGNFVNADSLHGSSLGAKDSPPRVLRSVEPEPDSIASALKYSGITVLGIVVEADGRVRYIEVVRPAGLGLDQKALAAMQLYEFAPAMQNGHPIRAYMEIASTFFVG